MMALITPATSASAPRHPEPKRLGVFPCQGGKAWVDGGVWGSPWIPGLSGASVNRPTGSQELILLPLADQVQESSRQTLEGQSGRRQYSPFLLEPLQPIRPESVEDRT